MHLDGELLVWEQELKQKRETGRVVGSISHQFIPVRRTEFRQRFALQRAIRHLAVISSQPGFTDFVLEAVIRINRRKILRPPGTRVEGRQHQQWIKVSHE